MYIGCIGMIVRYICYLSAGVKPHNVHGKTYFSTDLIETVNSSGRKLPTHDAVDRMLSEGRLTGGGKLDAITRCH